jgi:hypothetical protein
MLRQSLACHRDATADSLLLQARHRQLPRHPMHGRATDLETALAMSSGRMPRRLRTAAEPNLHRRGRLFVVPDVVPSWSPALGITSKNT